jgi:hypothetical protein
MLTGVGLVSTLAASITAYFLGTEENTGLMELKERTARIEGLLNTLLADRRPAAGEVVRESLPTAIGAAPSGDGAAAGRRAVKLP